MRHIDYTPRDQFGDEVFYADQPKFLKKEEIASQERYIGQLDHLIKTSRKDKRHFHYCPCKKELWVEVDGKMIMVYNVDKLLSVKAHTIRNIAKLKAELAAM